MVHSKYISAKENKNIGVITNDLHPSYTDELVMLESYYHQNIKITQGWTPDVIIGRKEKLISYSEGTLYR